jgi:hypothetical protein
MKEKNKISRRKDSQAYFSETFLLTGTSWVFSLMGQAEELC